MRRRREERAKLNETRHLGYLLEPLLRFGPLLLGNLVGVVLQRGLSKDDRQATGVRAWTLGLWTSTRLRINSCPREGELPYLSVCLLDLRLAGIASNAKRLVQVRRRCGSTRAARESREEQGGGYRTKRFHCKFLSSSAFVDGSNAMSRFICSNMIPSCHMSSSSADSCGPPGYLEGLEPEVPSWCIALQQHVAKYPSPLQVAGCCPAKNKCGRSVISWVLPYLHWPLFAAKKITSHSFSIQPDHH